MTKYAVPLTGDDFKATMISYLREMADALEGGELLLSSQHFDDRRDKAHMDRNPEHQQILRFVSECEACHTAITLTLARPSRDDAE